MVRCEQYGLIETHGIQFALLARFWFCNSHDQDEQGVYLRENLAGLADGILPISISEFCVIDD